MRAVETTRLYVVPQERHWPRYDASQERLCPVRCTSRGRVAASPIGRGSRYAVPLKLDVDFKSMRGQSGKAAVANLKKLSVMRASWNPHAVQASLVTDKVKAAFDYLMTHNSAYRFYVTEQDQGLTNAQTKQRNLTTYLSLLVRPPTDQHNLLACLPALQENFPTTRLTNKGHNLWKSPTNERLQIPI